MSDQPYTFTAQSGNEAIVSIEITPRWKDRPTDQDRAELETQVQIEAKIIRRAEICRPQTGAEAEAAGRAAYFAAIGERDPAANRLTEGDQFAALCALDIVSDLFTASPRESFTVPEILVILDNFRSDTDFFDRDVLIAQQIATRTDPESV